MKDRYLTYFESDADYQEYISHTTDYPNVSYVEGGNLHYNPILYTLTINYVNENDEPISNPYTKQMTYRANYAVNSPEITGYTTETPIVNGLITGDTTVKVIYTQNP